MLNDPFTNRSTAGQALAKLLTTYAGRQDVVVLGLARGGVPVAAEVARALRVPLDVFVVRKLGVPGHEEVALGAITSAGIRVINHPLARELGITPQELETITDRESRELDRRERAYRDGREPLDLHGRTVIVVDDGLATGASMSAAITALRLKRPRRIVVATPIASRDAAAGLRRIADEVVVVATPEPFSAVGVWYEDFAQTSDAEVRRLLADGTKRDRSTARIPSDGVVLQADLVVPERAIGTVIFAHGSGSGRHSARNRYVASILNEASLATLLLDLLTEEEAIEDEQTGHIRFDVQLLARRLGDAVRWVRAQPMLANRPIAYFGASTGAAAALIAAAHDPQIRAVVSRGGRPDLAASALGLVRAPTLLIVGGDDTQVLEYNRKALGAMHSRAELTIIPRATHLFEEPGALEEVASVARDWLTRRLSEHTTASAESALVDARPRSVV
ncbi:MAG: dienelactone hydrolase family protein [Gemmatimonadota bacterium]|nr:dienelactone hydrolase family protein [Gemmatimonadota bacterium]